MTCSCSTKRHDRQQRQLRHRRARPQLQVDHVAVGRRIARSSRRASTAPPRSCARICATSACSPPDSGAELLAQAGGLRAVRGDFLLGRRRAAAAARRGRRAAARRRSPSAAPRTDRRRPTPPAAASGRRAARPASGATRVASIELWIDVTRLSDTSICASAAFRSSRCALDVGRRRSRAAPRRRSTSYWNGRGSMRNSTSPLRTSRFGSTGTSMTRPVTRGRTCTTYFTTCTSSADGA